MASKKSKRLTPAEQSARFIEAAKKAEVGDAKAFDKAFTKILKKSSQRKR
jgi:hypothetical protein